MGTDVSKHIKEVKELPEQTREMNPRRIESTWSRMDREVTEQKINAIKDHRSIKSFIRLEIMRYEQFMKPTNHSSDPQDQLAFNTAKIAKEALDSIHNAIEGNGDLNKAWENFGDKVQINATLKQSLENIETKINDTNDLIKSLKTIEARFTKARFTIQEKIEGIKCIEEILEKSSFRESLGSMFMFEAARQREVMSSFHNESDDASNANMALQSFADAIKNSKQIDWNSLEMHTINNVSLEQSLQRIVDGTTRREITAQLVASRSEPVLDGK